MKIQGVKEPRKRMGSRYAQPQTNFKQMNTPIAYRKGIPFYYDKSEVEFQKDIYERYDTLVVRQSALHLADQLWGKYPMQGVFDFASPHYPDSDIEHILELGCGVGRWIATLAQIYPQASCWGVDYSYQMLKRAREFWLLGEDISMDLSNKGFLQPLTSTGHQLTNLNLGLAKASDLPFSDSSQDLILNSFLLDRLDDPAKGLAEMYRILQPNGKLIIVTPLNFDQARHWRNFHPPIKIYQVLTQIGFNILDWKEELTIEEPLDVRGNVVTWNCIGLVASKN